MTVTPAHEKLFLCMKWGTRYGSDYVNRLHSMIARHATPPFRLVCFTDDSSGVTPAVDCRPLPPLPGVPDYMAVLPWRKLSLWQRSLGADLDGRDALVLDLDLVVTGPLDEFFTYAPGRYAVIENWTKLGRKIGNTSVFRFAIGSHPDIYDRFIRDPEGLHRREFRIEQEYISAVLEPRGEQVFWPREWVRSFKEELLPAWPMRLFRPAPLPPSARLVVFHGKPDPDEAMVGRWPAPIWKKIYKTLRPVPWIEAHWS